MLLCLLACAPPADVDVPPKDPATDPGVTDSARDSGETGDSGDTAESSETGDSDTEPVVITGAFTVAQNSNNPFSALVTATVDHDAAVRVEYGEGVYDHATPAVDVKAGAEVIIPVLQLRAHRTFLMRLVAVSGPSSFTSEPQAYTTPTRPEGLPVCRPTFNVDESEFDRDEAVCTNALLDDGEHIYWCTDRWGEAVSWTRTKDDDSLMSMTPMPDGTFVSTSDNSAKLAFFDQTGKETAEFKTSWFDGLTRFTHEWIDNHEAYPITEGIYAGDVAFVTDAYEYFDDGDYKYGAGLILFNPVTRTVDYDYSFHGALGDQLEMDPKMPYSRDGWGDYAQDWSHLNSILHGTDPDGREYLLLSLKAQDWIFKLYPDTDELSWVLGNEGDFTLVDDIDAASPVAQPAVDWMYHQHGMHLVEAAGDRISLLMYDNGYPRHDEAGPNYDLRYSRVVILTLDQVSRQAEVSWSYGDITGATSDAMFSSYCGGASFLPGNDRILATEAVQGTMREISYPDGVERWRLRCDNVDICSYRGLWYPSLYETTWMYP